MEQWIEDARKGDPTAFEEIVRRYRGMALAAARAKLRDAALAEDAVQEAFAEAYLQLGKLRSAEAFPGWLRTIVERKCYRLLASYAKSALPVEDIASFSIGQGTDPAVVFEQKELQRQVKTAMDSLPVRLRDAVQLFYIEGRPVREVAEALGTTVSAMKKRLFDARYKLRSSLPVANLLSMYRDLYEGGEAMLHVVNGDVMADKLRQGIVQGEILVWREIYPVGPVFRNMTPGESLCPRAAYLESRLGIPRQQYLENCEAQERVLRDFRKYREIVLWFEHDLFDQTMLAFLLHWFARQPSLGDTRLSLLCIGSYPGIEDFRGLGQLSLEQLGALTGTWQAIGPQEMELGRRVWEAYASADPGDLLALLEGDLSPLPYMREAILSHLSRLPSTVNGLGCVEQTVLELAAQGTQRPYDLFRQVGSRLNALGMGDLEFRYRLAALAKEPFALLRLEAAEDRLDVDRPLAEYANGGVALTELGRKVLAGTEDWVTLKPLDEWFGGLHLQGSPCRWRWDPASETIRPG